MKKKVVIEVTCGTVSVGLIVLGLVFPEYKIAWWLAASLLIAVVETFVLQNRALWLLTMVPCVVLFVYAMSVVAAKSISFVSFLLDINQSVGDWIKILSLLAVLILVIKLVAYAICELARSSIHRHPAH